ncbi:MAG: TlpA family protein disulfide reductase [Sphingobacteriaceae bacterium]|jgi:peroxiredoxin|nr:TlpA family protein disulfide reductase [Sphingobacteriaceae bacterium]
MKGLWSKSLLLLVSVLSVLTIGCNTKDPELKNGTWRATLKTDSGVEIPFNFSVFGNAGEKQINILNGSETFNVKDIKHVGDSVFIKMPLFDSEIRAAYNGNNLSGNWIKHLATSDVLMPFNAEPDASWRFFKADNKSAYNVNGRWSAVFVSEDGKDTTITVGEFNQKGSHVTGTFLTTTGDYRFLEGTVSDDNLYLSCFDGSHAFLFTGKIQDSVSITDGKFYSGFKSIENWTAKKDPKAMLPDAYALTALKAGQKTISFSFPDLNGKQVSLADDRYKAKVVVVQFMGSWCPNCMDETAYLAPIYEKYKSKGLEVIGLAYERSTDVEKARRNVGSLKDRFDVTYPLLITGYTNDKGQVTKSLPMLNSFEAFPTTIIIDKKGQVRKIHTGFSGPGTGSHYTEFTAEFEKLINSLLAE